MKRVIVFAYGVASYVLFLAVFLYAIGFVGNFGVPKSLDSPSSRPLTEALLIDVALLSVFALQHSVMARRSFKRFITRFIPVSAERSTYVLASSLALALLFWKWEPLGGVIWDIESGLGRGILHAGYAFGWALVLIATFVINHFDLFGLRQVWRELLGKSQTPVPFVTPMLYRIVRHPLYVGWLFVFWCTPTMTVTHLFLAVMITAYILIAIRFEEADLMREHPHYESYRKTVPMLIPRLRGTAGAALPTPVKTRSVARAIAAAGLILSGSAMAQNNSIPSELRVPDGHKLFLRTQATGTQNYVCTPGADGPVWKFLGPQATVFVPLMWPGGEIRHQIATHFLSANPDEAGTPRATWQHSVDTSAVWARAIATVAGPPVAEGAIPWLLLRVVGSEAGPAGGSWLSRTTYIQRLNTTGGAAPATGCDAANYGAMALVPYTTDYLFYAQETRP